jgi:peptidoglycan/LPS O-acetylase OafA/YrhL
MKQPASLTEKRFIAPLHGLRGIAVLYVVISHLGNGGLFLLPIPHDAIGKVGVWIFFALSAFLLTTHLCRELETTSSRVASLLQYIAHRVFRIYPLYIFVLISHFALDDISKTDFFKHILLIQGLGELWAIPVEFQYYFIIPVIAITSLYIPRRYVSLLLMAALMASLIYSYQQPASVFSNELNVFPKIAPFLFGSMLALLPYKKVPSEFRKLYSLIPWVCLAGLLATTVLYRYVAKGYLSNLFAPWLSLAIGAAAVGLIYAALKPNPIASLLGSRPLAYLGKISFSIYLLHMFVLRLVQKTTDLPVGMQAWFSLGLCVLCASFSYWAIERPGISAGKIIGQYLREFSFRGHRQSTVKYSDAP